MNKKTTATTSRISSVFLMCTICFIFIIGTVFRWYPSKALALVPPTAPFGGLDVFDDYSLCTCSYSNYSWFAPLYFSNLPITGPLTSYPGVVNFQYYYIHSGAWALGAYIPGQQVCEMYVYNSCVVVPSYGNITGPTGTSP